MATKRTALFDAHLAAGARIVEFAGFEMPVQYQGVIEEHRRVREHVGLFDVSHMGEIEIRGPRALDAVQHLVTNDAAAIKDTQAMYAGLLYESGGFVDDLIVYRYSPERIFICVNASNKDKDYAWIKEQVGKAFTAGAEVIDRSDEFTQIAVQGPKAETLIGRLADRPVDKQAIPYYWFKDGNVIGRPAIIARTGYTGEDGFELYLANKDGRPVWDALLEKGRDLEVGPVGLGARDTLRLEMKYALYGNDIDQDHTPVEAGLSWIVAFGKSGFIGKPVLDKQKAEGVQRKLVGFEMIDRGIPRHGYPIVDASGKPIGVVTSGTQSPSLNKPIAMGYVPAGQAKVGTEHRCEVRGKPLRMRVVKTPFYKKS
ncbi:MAG: glycine cleavage system aminomethyltransferase GcvT [Deltaproteobacteria bacterium]|nr:glycine cleavage system aminomethyltransferase GcvT [Deltaproteobacteria bacterium]